MLFWKALSTYKKLNKGPVTNVCNVEDLRRIQTGCLGQQQVRPGGPQWSGLFHQSFLLNLTVGNKAVHCPARSGWALPGTPPPAGGLRPGRRPGAQVRAPCAPNSPHPRLGPLPSKICTSTLFPTRRFPHSSYSGEAGESCFLKPEGTHPG